MCTFYSCTFHSSQLSIRSQFSQNVYITFVCLHCSASARHAEVLLLLKFERHVRVRVTFTDSGVVEEVASPERLARRTDARLLQHTCDYGVRATMKSKLGTAEEVGYRTSPDV